MSPKLLSIEANVLLERKLLRQVFLAVVLYAAENMLVHVTL